MIKKAFMPFLLAFLFVCGPAIGNSMADDLGTELRRELQDSRTVVAQATGKLKTGGAATAELVRLKYVGEKIRASHLLMRERFQLRTEKVSPLGVKAVERQGQVTEAYDKALTAYLALLDALPPDGTISPETLDALTTLIDKIVPRQKRPLLGALPYKHLGYPAREPATSPVIVPAYRGGDRTVTPADTAASTDAPISGEIAALAQSLQWNPVLIYEWVKNNVETEWYWGVMKGAQETLRQKSGNDADQAALLTGLLRASGFPTRYVRGIIEFFPGIDKVKNLTGLDDPMQIASFFQKAGIPFKPIIAGGGIGNFRIEHIWVETFIPYSNYRGAVVDGQGKSWLAIDTSIKPQGYTRTVGADLPEGLLSNLRRDYMAAPQELTPLEYIRNRADASPELAASGKTYQDLLSSKALIPDVLKIIPSSLQFVVTAITGEYTSLPADLTHKVTFSATASGSNLFSITLDTAKLSNSKLIMSYEPESVEDQQIIDSFGGIDNTPGYLVRLRPVLILDGERMVVGQDGLPVGADYLLDLDVATPNGTERVSSGQIAGNMAAFGIVAQKAIPQGALKEEDDAATILSKEAIGYIDRWNQGEDELAALLKQSIIRPAVSAVAVGGQVDVTWLMDSPQEMTWKGVFIDAGYRRIESVGRNGGDRDFVQVSALQGSLLENRIFEDDLKVDSVSTAKLLQLANVNGIPLISIEMSNLDAVLPTLPFDDAVKQDIANAVNQNLLVTIPQAEITYLDWSGVGYLKENAETGESGWMLTGGIAGGMTAARVWVNSNLQETLGNPNTKSNKDRLSAARIIKIPVTDMQRGTVGTDVKEKLAVLVTDKDGRPVEGASVSFSVIAGGGTIKGTQTVTTGRRGIAAVDFTLGERTSDNPIYFKVGSQDEQLTQVGLNLVTATVETRVAQLSVVKPFQAYGIPGNPTTIVKGFGDGTTSLVNNPVGSLQVKVVDSYGNPTSNVTVLYQPLPPSSKDASFTLPLKTRNVEFYHPEACSNAYPFYKDCLTSFAVTQKTGFDGCFVNAILGDTVNTQYTVKVNSVSHPQLAPVTFNLASEGHRKDGEYLPPALLIRYLDYYNSSGQRVNSTRAGTTLKKPLTSDLFMLIDDYAMVGPKTCVKTVLGIDIPYDCWQIVPSGITNVERITDGKVSYTVTDGGGTVGTTDNMRDGKYQASFTASPVPELNTIVAQGSATVTIPEVLVNPDTGKALVDGYPADRLTTRKIAMQSSKQVLFSKTTKEPVFGDTDKLTSFLVYGVDVKLSMKPSVIAITKEGHAKRDTAFTYTILPAAYNGLLTDIDFFSTDQSNVETWMGSLLGEKTQGQGTSSVLAGSQWDIHKQNFAQVVLNNGSDIKISGDKVPVPIALGALVPDYNHDRKIDESDRVSAELQETYYFWINDDDGHGDTEGTGIPGSGNLTNPTTVTGTRDLTDFFPVYLDTKELQTVFPPSVYTYKLQHETSSLNVVETALEPSGSGKYLTDVPTAQGLALSPKMIITTGGYTLSNAILDGKGIVLVDGWKEATTPIRLAVFDVIGKLVHEDARLNLSIAGVEQMFRHKNLIRLAKGGEGPLPAHNSKPGGEPDRFIGLTDQPANFPDAEENNSNLVVLHGYNVDGQEARGFHAEMFKRLYWAGSKARFWAVSWYGAETKKYLANLFTPDYHTNVVNAFDTASVLKDFLSSSVKGDVTLMAHSLGNVVVSAMLSDNPAFWDNASSTRIKNYLMVDAAVAIEAYDGSAAKNPDMVHQAWSGYKESLWASEWHQRFTATDHRSKLTWRDRFKARPVLTKYYNFYSSGEEVLATLTANTPITDVFIEQLNQLGSYAWAVQEKLKGANPLSVDIIGNSLGGWGFNGDDTEYYVTKLDVYGYELPIPISATNAELIDENILMTKPFFKKGPDPDLYFPGITGSTYARNNMNRLLGGAMPARTLPAGANAVESFGDEDTYNFNMEIKFKNNNNDWPAIRAPFDNWRHSDLKDVSYPFVFNLFDNFVSLGGLK